MAQIELRSSFYLAIVEIEITLSKENYWKFIDTSECTKDFVKGNKGSVQTQCFFFVENLHLLLIESNLHDQKHTHTHTDTNKRTITHAHISKRHPITFEQKTHSLAEYKPKGKFFEKKRERETNKIHLKAEVSKQHPVKPACSCFVRC